MSHAPDLNVLIVEHQSDDTPQLLGERLASARADVTVVGPHLENPIPASLDGFDALVVLGGTPGPTEDDKAPWLPGVRALLAQALERETPTLGICLGAQMLATVAGGRVDNIEAGPEIGLTQMSLTEEGRTDPLLSVLTEFEAAQVPIQALQWHWLEAKELPPGSVPLMSSQACNNQAFRVGQLAWGVQFHPEALGQAAADWSAADSDSLVQLGLAAQTDVVEPVVSAEPTLRSTWSKLFDRWIELAQSRRASHTEVP